MSSTNGPLYLLLQQCQWKTTSGFTTRSNSRSHLDLSPRGKYGAALSHARAQPSRSTGGDIWSVCEAWQGQDSEQKCNESSCGRQCWWALKLKVSNMHAVALSRGLFFHKTGHRGVFPFTEMLFFSTWNNYEMNMNWKCTSSWPTSQAGKHSLMPSCLER